MRLNSFMLNPRLLPRGSDGTGLDVFIIAADAVSSSRLLRLKSFMLNPRLLLGADAEFAAETNLVRPLGGLAGGGGASSDDKKDGVLVLVIVLMLGLNMVAAMAVDDAVTILTLEA